MSNVLVDKPVATTGAANTVAVAVVGYCIYRGWIPEPLGLLAIGVVVAGLTTIAHELVTPWRKVKQVVEDGLHITDADFGRLEAVLEQYGLEVIAKSSGITDLASAGLNKAYLQQLADHGPDALPAVTAADIPDGMAAGAPTDHAPEHAANPTTEGV